MIKAVLLVPARIPSFLRFGWPLIGFALALLVSSPRFADAAEAQQPAGTVAIGSASVEALVQEAVGKSAELAALQARIRSAEAMVAPASALPDPMASVGMVNIPVHSGIRLDQDTMSGLEVMVSQDLPRTKKRRLSGQSQSLEARMLRARYDDKRNNLVKLVKQTYFELQYLDEAIHTTDGNKQLAQDILKAAEAQYSTGKGVLQDVFQAQGRLSQMLNMLVEMRQDRAMTASKLSKLLYRPPDTPVGETPPLQRTEVTLEAQALIDRALAASPQLAEMGAKLGQQETKLNLARQEIKPDFKVEFRYMFRQPVGMDPMSGTDMWSAIVGVNLPWVYRRQKVDQDVKAAQSEQTAAGQDIAAMRNELGQMVQSMVIDVNRANQQISLVETALLPQAEGALASSKAAYQTGQLPFVSLLDNQMNLYTQQLRRAELLEGREKSLAELEYLVGGELVGAGAVTG
jgi:outer membrane protein TolC